jgi:ribosomal protein S18 acetylase RimI-like enzyme
MQNEELFEVRLLGESDIPAAVRLKEIAGWNQTEADWRRLLRLEPEGCFCTTVRGLLVGTTTTTTYGRDLAWIGMVLVDPDYRRLGIATRMMNAALEYLHDAGVGAVKLDATADGRQVYENLGFRIESLIERWEGVAVDQAVDCLTLDSSARPEALTVDRSAFGADRSKLIEMLFEDACVAPFATKAPDGRLTGYALARRGTAAAYVGPLVTTTSGGAPPLLDGLLSQLTGQRVYIDLNTGFTSGREVLAARGFVKQRDLIRMCYGETSQAGTSPSIFGIAGPEFG